MKRREFIKTIGLGVLCMGVTPGAFAGAKNKRSNKKKCQLMWEEMCGNGNEVYKNNAFNYIHPAKRTPNVLIYGDSISIAYTPEVRNILEGKASVFRLYKNGGSSHNFIPNMDKMNDTMFQPHLEGGWNFEWDLIHFNVGLHDLKYLKGKHLNKNGKQVSSTSEYKENLHKICKYLKNTFPRAKLIFATTTPVPENAKGRFAGDSVKYNKAAREVLTSYPNIAINDLYTLTLPHLKEWAQEPGNVHHKELGYTQQAKKVASVITYNL